MGTVVRALGMTPPPAGVLASNGAVVGSRCSKTVVGITLLCASSVTGLAAICGHDEDGGGIITVFV